MVGDIIARLPNGHDHSPPYANSAQARASHWKIRLNGCPSRRIQVFSMKSPNALDLECVHLRQQVVYDVFRELVRALAWN